ncbi:toll/interleukin-1 receptor domain-containing protein [Micromonospora siamensis]|uniref:toll/interleukin-1 receptor domain-containing protein n=1 Tax=Micromonospora siamensis TaxID=299152 RepID=UPI0012FD61D7|nr:toll/interleukin-1 receptor domain-containing protein [Micromonospora siamensis]
MSAPWAGQSYRYWAFISYSHTDRRFARALHRRLEGYRLPRRVRPSPWSAGPSPVRLRPVFRDHEELPASTDLGGHLRVALDQSRNLVVLASSGAARSRWVDSEVRHFLDRGRAHDILLVVRDGNPGDPLDPAVLPPALRGRVDEALWVDTRGTRRPSRTAFLRLVAGMVGVGFDALWRRDRRRRWRRALSLSLALTLLFGIGGGLVWRAQRQRADSQPSRQVQQFRAFYQAKIERGLRDEVVAPGASPSTVDFQILRSEDLNGDDRLDYFVINHTTYYCGSGGCHTEVYVADGGGRFHQVLTMFAASTPRTRPTGSGAWKEILATTYQVANQPVYDVYASTGAGYQLSRLEFCGKVFIEYCHDPQVVLPLKQAAPTAPLVRRGAAVRTAPDAAAPALSLEPQYGSRPRVVGRVLDAPWFLVELWKGESGFVSADDVSKS